MRPISCLLVIAVAGCAPRPAPHMAPSPAPAGRLVPAAVSGFERGAGAWHATQSGKVLPVATVGGGASRGRMWLAIGPAAPGRVEASVKTPSQNWNRFGDAVRADVRAEGTGKTTARLLLAGPDGKQTLGPESPVSTKWTTLVWKAGPALSSVARLGVLWTTTGATTRLGLDNVRIGAAAGLNQAFSVAYGPYPSRDATVDAMRGLKASGIDSFPIYEEGWFLNLGTFRTKSAAMAEAKRFRTRGLKVTLLVR